MKKATLILIVTLMSLTAHAQTQTTGIKFGYLSYDAALKAIPGYAEMEADMAELHGQYEAEQQRVENEFNKKYEEFLDGQASFPKTILQKRQSELQEMLDKNIAFKTESKKLLCKARCEAKAALKQKLDDVLAQIGQQRGYAFILNTDGNATPWLNPEQGDDITNDVKALLQQ